MFTPISAAAVALFESARIAIPSLVRFTMKVSATSKEMVTMNAASCVVVIVSAPVPSSARSGINSGNDFGSAPKTNCPPYSRNSETPIAVMSTVSFGRARKGRYAIFSIAMPSRAQMSIVKTKTEMGPSGAIHPVKCGSNRGLR